MANVKKWSYSTMIIKYGKDPFDRFSVDSAMMDSDVQCIHCGKNIKTGKLVFCSSYGASNPFTYGDNKWGDGRKKTFCSSNHAKLYVKNGGSPS